jgi:hypothetical protein
MADRVSDFRDNLEDEHESQTQAAMETIQSRVETEIQRNDSVARRVLISDVQEDAYSGSSLVSRHVHVPGWAKYVEHGTGQRGRRDTLPNHETYEAPDPLPPLDPILTWVLEKTLTSSTYDSKYALAEAIARSIGEQGTFPHPFLRVVWFGTDGWRAVKRANRRAQRRALRQL